MYNIAKNLLLVIMLSALAVFSTFSSFAVTTAEVAIESHAELYYGYTAITSETLVTTVEQMYGITIEPPALSASASPATTHYFSHSITNLGNGSDRIRFHFKVATPETWTFGVVTEEGGGPLDNPLLMAEEAVRTFYIAMTIPVGAYPVFTGEALLIATTEVCDGSYYIGANSIIYGGPDTAEAHDLLTVAGEITPRINRDDATGKIYITWNGAAAEILYIEGTFDATFTNATNEMPGSFTSPYYCSVEAKDGKTRYYKLKLNGRSVPEPQILGKFDVRISVGLNELSSPLVPYERDPAHLVGRQVTGATSANNADRLWKYNPAAQGSYDIAWLVQGAGPSYDGKWYTGSTPTTITIGTDEGYILEIRTGHPASYVTMIGEVSTTSRTVEVALGMNFIGTCFPVEVTLEGSNLWQSGMWGASSANNADRVWKYNPVAQGSYDIAWLIDGVSPTYNGKWYSGSYPTKLKLMPGYGYWLEIRPTHHTFQWKYKKPY